MTRPAYAAVDWGTSNLRLWLMDADGNPLASSTGAEGLESSGRRGFPETLEHHLDSAGAPSGLPVVICGMAGARTGWKEAPYLKCPASLDDVGSAAIVVDHVRPVRILPGMSLEADGRFDVMRGEETQLAGVAGDGKMTVCLPGTHSKWAMLDGRRVGSFRTWMTGELYALLSRHSILRHSVGDGSVSPDGAVFARAVEDALGGPVGLSARLFDIRARGLLGSQSPSDAASALSGTLIGAEIADAVAVNPDPGTVRIVGGGSLAALYAKALSIAGIRTLAMDGEKAVQAGLHKAATSIFSI